MRGIKILTETRAPIIEPAMPHLIVQSPFLMKRRVVCNMSQIRISWLISDPLDVI